MQYQNGDELMEDRFLPDEIWGIIAVVTLGAFSLWCWKVKNRLVEHNKEKEA